MKSCLLFLSTIAFLNSFSQNTALTFNGTTQYATIGTPIATGSSYTKEAWVYLTNATGSKNIVSSQYTPLWINAGYLSAGQGITFSLVVDPTPFPLNKWTHVAVTYDASTLNLNLYRDGTLVALAPLVAAPGAEATYIGAHTSALSYFQGSMDEVRIWNRPLSAAELKLNLYKGPAFNSPGLVAYYKMEEGSGTLLNNSSTNGTPVNGTTVGTPTFGASPIVGLPNGINFDGSDDYINLGPGTELKPVTALTEEIWVRSSNWVVGSQQQITSNYESGGYGITLNGGNLNFLMRTTNSAGNYIGVSYPQTSLVNNQWTHVAGTFDGRYIRMYVNGVLVGTNDLGSSGNLIYYSYSGNAFLVGAEATQNATGNAGWFFQGDVDELRIWNVARTAPQIAAAMNTELNPTDAVQTAGLVGYYTFNQGIQNGNNNTLTTLIDTKGSNNGTLIGFGLNGPASNFVNPAISLIALPVVYKSFTARVNGDDALLQWTTAQEQNSRDFTVEHSIDGTNFRPLAKIDAAGTTTRESDYSYTHTKPTRGSNYYRLVQSDLDGKSSISEVRKLMFDGSNKSMVLIGNIATNGQLQLQINRKTPVSLYTMDGKLLFKRQFNPGTHRLELARYSKGMYWLSAEGSIEKIMIR